MYIKFLGSGSAFTLKNYQTNALLFHGNKKLLIDCGTDIRHSLNFSCLSYKDVDDIYISHLHSDHVGGLEYIGFSRYFDESTDRPTIYCNSNLEEHITTLLIISFGNEYDKYFNLKTDLSSFNWNGIEFNMLPIRHIVEVTNASAFTYSIGWKSPSGRIIFYSSDVQFINSGFVLNFYSTCDIIFHDCETYETVSGVHAHYNQLKQLPEEIKTKIYLMHYNDNVSEDFDFWIKESFDDGFKSFVLDGEEFNI